MQTQRKNDRIEKTQTITQNQAHNQELKFTASKLNKNVKDLVSSLRQEIYFQVQCLQIPLPVTLFIVMYKLNSTQRHSANNIYCSLVDMAHYQCSNFLDMYQQDQWISHSHYRDYSVQFVVHKIYYRVGSIQRNLPIFSMNRYIQVITVNSARAPANGPLMGAHYLVMRQLG